MPKILVCGDLHGKKESINKVETTILTVKEFSKKVPITVLLGDINDNKAVVRSEIQNLYLKHFKDWPNNLYILVGNHDLHNSIECKDHSLEPYKGFKNVTVIDKVFSHNNLLFMPYYHDLYKFKQHIQRLKSQVNVKFDYLFMHQGVDGCLFSSGMSEVSDLKLDDLVEFKRVIAGHIHKKQEMNNLYYVGSPFTQNFGEANEDKGIILFDTDKNEITECSLGLPKHVIIKDKIETLDDLVKFEEARKEYNDDDIVQFVVEGPSSVVGQVNRDSFKCKVDSVKTSPVKEEKKILLKPSMTPEAMAEVYINSLDTQLDKEELCKISKEILEGVK